MTGWRPKAPPAARLRALPHRSPVGSFIRPYLRLNLPAASQDKVVLDRLALLTRKPARSAKHPPLQRGPAHCQRACDHRHTRRARSQSRSLASLDSGHGHDGGSGRSRLKADAYRSVRVRFEKLGNSSRLGSHSCFSQDLASLVDDANQGTSSLLSIMGGQPMGLMLPGELVPSG